MRISVDSPYGLTGSETIDGLYVYFSETKFTPANLPEPYKNNTTSYSGYTIEFPIKDKPYWVMWSYRGRDNQRVYSSAVCLMDFSPELTEVFNGYLMILAGDAMNGQLPSLLSQSELIYPDSFSMKAGLEWMWDRGNSPIAWYLVNGKRIGVNTLPNKDTCTALELYQNGYLGKVSSDIVYSPQMVAALGPTVTQGRVIDSFRMHWEAFVPTLDEFRINLGVIFQSGIATIAPPVTKNTLDAKKWFLTCTEANGFPGRFYAINAKGELKAVLPTDPVSVYLLFTGDLIKT